MDIELNLPAPIRIMLDHARQALADFYASADAGKGMAAIDAHLDLLADPAFHSVDGQAQGCLLGAAGNAFLARYQWLSGDMNDLEHAQNLLDGAVARLGNDLVRHDWLQDIRCTALSALFEATGDRAHLDAALTIARARLARLPVDASDRIDALDSYAGLLADDAEQDGTVDAYATAINAVAEAIRATPQDAPERPRRLSRLAHLYSVRHHCPPDGAGPDPANLESAVLHYRQAMEALPSAAMELPLYGCNLAAVLLDRHSALGNEGDLDEAAALLQTALATVDPGVPHWSAILRNLGYVLLARFELRGSDADLECALDLHRRLADAPGRSVPERAKDADDLGRVLLTRYERRGDATNLDEAIVCHRQALADAGPQFAPTVLTGLGLALRLSYLHRGDARDLADAIACLEQAATRHPGPAAHVWNNLGLALTDHCILGGDSGDLARAIDCHRRALESTPPTAQDYAAYLSNLGVALLRRHEADGHRDDLVEAVAAFEATLGMTPEASPWRPGRAANLGGALLDQYALGRDPELLARAIDLCRSALEAAAADASNIPLYASSLATAYHTRYELSGSLDDLDACLALRQRAVDAVPPGAGDRAVWQNNLAIALIQHYERRAVGESLDRAIALWEDCTGERFYLPARALGAVPAARDVPVHDPRARMVRTAQVDLPVWLMNLGLGLRERYLRDEDDADLTRAVETLERAAALARDATSYDPLLALGICLMDAYQAHREAARLYAAVAAFERALDSAGGRALIRDDHLRGSLGLALLKRFELTGEDADRRRGEALLRDLCAGAASGSPPLVLNMLQSWGHWAFARGEWAIAGEAYVGAWQASERLFAGQARRHDRESWLRETQGLAARLAFALARVGDLDGALRALEQGAARLVTEALRRTSGDSPGRAWPTAAQGQLARPTRRDERWVYLATTAAGSLALVVASDGLTALWSDFTEGELVDILVGSGRSGPAMGYARSMLLDATALRDRLPEILGRLGARLIGEVAAHLRQCGTRHLVLLPLGRLALLPLAASTYPGPTDPRCLLDALAVTWAPTAETLLSARARLSSADRSETFLGIGATLCSARPLPASREEIRGAAAWFPEATCITDPSEIGESLGEQLGRAAYLHFACHGEFDLNEPLDSFLALSDTQALTLREILDGDVRPRRARLVVLSACRTAVNDFHRLPDEAVGFPSALLQGDVAGVIGTLWPTEDCATAKLMLAFYRYLRGARLAPAEALRRAQCWLRHASAEQLGVAAYYQGLFDASRQRDAESYRRMRHYRACPKETPFQNPYYWAGFVFYGA